MPTHKGSCHCGTVRYEVAMDIDDVMSCNCSICRRKGTLLAFTPEVNFTLISGENNLTDYQFGKKAIHHLFCKTCGISAFARGAMPDGTKMVAINVRCLDDVEVGKLPVKAFDGKSL